MKIFIALRSGTVRASNAWKGILISWFITFLLALFVSGPVKSLVKSSLDNSMIAERLATHLDLEVLQDPGMHLNTLISVIIRGFLLLVPLSIIINSFLSGGLFRSLKSTSPKFSASSFWKSSSEYFFPFLIISMIMSLIILVLGVLVLGVPAAIVASSGDLSDVAIIRTLIVSFIVLLLILTIPVLASDYARAWLVSTDIKKPFRAVGFGFRQTFRHFSSSWLIMIIFISVQLFYMLTALRIVSKLSPATYGSIILLFLVSQLFLFGRIYLRVIRFGCITSLMEINAEKHAKETIAYDENPILV